MCIMLLRVNSLHILDVFVWASSHVFDSDVVAGGYHSGIIRLNWGSSSKVTTMKRRLDGDFVL